MDKKHWKIEDIFKNKEELEKTTNKIEEKSIKFSNMYKGNLKNLKTTEFLEAIKEYEDISQGIGEVMTYAFLCFATNSNEGSFYGKYQEICTKIHENLLFFELEFNRLNKQTQDNFIEISKKYEYYLTSLKEEKSHQLSQKEEMIMLKKSPLGASAFSRLFDEHFSKLTFNYERKKISEEEVLSLLHSPDRNVRKKAASSLTKGLVPHQHLLGYIFNMIKKDLKIKCELRKYKSPEEPRHQDNKISQKSVNSLIETVEKNFDIVYEYYDLKRQILGYDKLYDYDRYAPLESKNEEYSFEKSKKIVLDAFGKFSPKFKSIANKAFNDGWIDIYPKENKRGGAFSHPSTKNSHPYVLLNYTNQRRDLFTLSHELGHAIHQYLSYEVGYLGSDTPLTTAETASVFAEMLVFDYIKDKLDDKSKLAMLAGKLEDIFATLYRQINFTTFERKVHGFKGEISLEKLNEFWLEENKKMFGKSVELGKNYEIWWSYIPHFIHSPFYCYAYSYGQLLVLALYGLYKSGKNKKFTETYTKFLSLGGSKSPKQLVKMFGLDIESEEFWLIGLGEVRKMLEEFKGLAKC